MKDLALRSDFPQNIDEQIKLTRTLAQGGILPDHLRQQPANILVIGMAARALDISLFTAMQQIVPIEGKVGMQADLMRGLVIRAGHKFRVLETSREAAHIVIIRSDDPEFEHHTIVRIDDIPRTLLDRPKGNWVDWREDMLVARATAKACRRACSDVLNGMIYTPDELGADVEDDGHTVTVTAARPDSPANPAASAAAQALRDAADREAAGVDADGVVDAEEVPDEPGAPAATQPVPPEPAPAGTGTPLEAETPARGLEEPVDGDLDLRPPVLPDSPVRAALVKVAAEKFGAGWAAEIETRAGLPWDRLDNAALKRVTMSN